MDKRQKKVKQLLCLYAMKVLASRGQEESIQEKQMDEVTEKIMRLFY